MNELFHDKLQRWLVASQTMVKPCG